MQSRRKAQESLRNAFHSLFIAFVISLMVMSGTGAQALEVTVSYSFPEVGEWVPPPASIVEGSITATFSGDEPINPITATAGLQQVDSTTWNYRFAWDWIEPVTISFAGLGGDTVEVVATPQADIPFGSESHELMTFHITTDFPNLWDPEIGLYVYGHHANFLQHGVEWERAAQLDFFNPMDSTSFSEPIGLRIHGGWSRRFSQKSFRFYFDDYGVSNDLVYDFFDGGPTTFQRLLLRTHRFPFNCFNSNILESIWLDQGHLGSRIQPAVGYVNGEYWGTYSLRERLDDEFLEVTHGIEPNTYIFIKDGIVERGDPTDWANLIATFSEPQEFDSHAWFEDMSSRIDLNTYVDWLIINIYAATADNGFDANLAQLKRGDGPWEFIMWDEDDTFFPQNLNADIFQFFASEDQAAFEANWPPVFYYDGWDPTLQPWCNMFRGFMQNSEFKSFFFGRLEELMATELSPAAIDARIDAIVAEQGMEMDLHAQRWNWNSAAEFTDHADELKSFAAARHGIVQQQAADFKEDFRQPVELISFEASIEEDGVHLNWTTQGERGNDGFVVLRENPAIPDVIEGVDFYFNNPNLLGQEYSDDLNHYSTVDSDPTMLGVNKYILIWVDQMGVGHRLPWSESIWVSDWKGLVINELMADNDSILADGAGEFDDWFELFNGSNATVSLDSLFVTDDLANPMRHQLTGGLQIAPGEHLLLWADGFPEQGSDHLNFRLSAAGEGIYLFGPDGETLVTSIEFGLQVTDVSLARESDGSSRWAYSAAATPGAANGDPCTQSLLRLNELMGINDGSISDELGEFDPWLEIFNPLPVSISLDQLELRLTGRTGGPWFFTDVEMPPGHKIFWLDGQPEQGDFHAPYIFTPEYGIFEFLSTSTGERIDTLDWAEIPLIGSIARVPDGVGAWQSGVEPTAELPNPLPVLSSALRINEFMALNGTIIADETGIYEDWVEIYNPGTEVVSLAGMYLTDDLAVPNRWAFPDTTIDAGEYMIVWCDSDPEDGPLHTNFKLSAIGEAIGLYSNVDEVMMYVDGYTFGNQVLDVSEGRSVDGRDGWEFFTTPSPGTANNSLSPVIPGVVLTTGLQSNYPNPFNPSTTIVYTLDKSTKVSLTIHDLRGRLVARLVQQWHPAGHHQVVWDGSSTRGNPVASGTYLVLLRAGTVQDSRRVMLLK